MPLSPTFEAVASAFVLLCAFVLALFVGSFSLPGKHWLGFPQPDGLRKRYKLTGMSLFVATHIVVANGIMRFGWSPTTLIRHFWDLLIAANIFAAVWTLVLYSTGRARSGSIAHQGRFSMVRDLWYGMELNPEWMGVDLKVFAYQPSLIGLGVLNFAFAWTQFELYGTLSPQMILYQAFWWSYLVTHYWFERGVLSMWDVIAERFGFMLVWGDLVLVPFFYCIGGWYLLHELAPMSVPVLTAILLLFATGLWVFREANAQKDRFKRDASSKIWGKPAEALGGKLLVSGWWGFARKINYTGEISVYLSFALATGTHSLVPYLLPLWLCVLLPHRAWRDEQRCRAKYGPLWTSYCERARFRMIPFIY